MVYLYKNSENKFKNMSGVFLFSLYGPYKTKILKFEFDMSILLDIGLLIHNF